MIPHRQLTPILFSKPLQRLPVEAMAAEARAMGFQGIDLTARPGGHVEPSSIGAALPRARAACEKAGAPVVMLTTDLKSPGDDDAESTFAAASECGIRFLKLGYHPYRHGQYRQSLDRMRRDADGFEAMAARYGVVCACHHIHSADFMTQSAFTLARILEGHNPDHLGAYVDPCHMWIEGTLQNWLMGLEVLHDKIRLVAIKDFSYPAPPKRLDEGFQYPPFVPLRRGVVAWTQVMRVLLSDYGYRGPLSFHMEYTGLTPEQEKAAAADDLAYLTEVIDHL